MTRIFHGPNNVSGAAELLARAQRSLGFESHSVCLEMPHQVRQVDQEISTTLRGRLGALMLAKDYDIFQFYYGTTLLLGLGVSDISLLRLLKKKVFLYFCGCDIRDSKVVLDKYDLSGCQVCWPQKCHPHRDKLAQLSQNVDGVFVSTPDLLEFIPNAIVLPQPVDIDYLRSFRKSRQRTDTIRLAHAPSSSSLKGTKHIVECVDELKRKNYPVDLVLIENMPYAEVLKLTSECDISIDQLLIGAYGQYSVEAMALGLPTICYIRQDLAASYPPDLPIISATPTSLLSVLLNLIEQRDNWNVLGHLGMNYVSKYHASENVAKIALRHYQLLPSNAT